MRTFALLVLTSALLSACPDLVATGTATDGGTAATGSTTTGGPPTTALPDLTTTGFMLECYPDAVRCSPDTPGVLETCAPTGLEWQQSPCSDNEDCVEDVEKHTAACIGPCELITNPTSLGCEFLAIRVQSHNYDPGDTDALIVGNTDEIRTARVQLHFTPDNSLTEAPLGDPVLLAPGEAHKFDLPSDPMSNYSSFRTGGVYRVTSDVPIAAYLHSALVNEASNDASMLLPVSTLRKDHVIASYPGFADAEDPVMGPNGRPSYFNVIALENDTTVEWVAARDTAAFGQVIPAVKTGETGTFKLNRFDVLQIGSSSLANLDFITHDVSGTVVTADRPIWVLGGVDCAFVPWGVGYCNHLQEQMIPVEYWGRKYVGPHAPARSDEKHYWRIYAGADNVTVTVESNNAEYKPGPKTLFKRGDWYELTPVPHGTSLIFTATGPILPVQYLTGGTAAVKEGDPNTYIGDPAMYQMVAVEQWLRRYVFVTGVDYHHNYAQVIRRKDAADVTINGEVVSGYYLINGDSQNGPNQWEVADVPLGAGSEPRTFVAESQDEFNVVVVGYTEGPQTSAYAYPGGMNLKKFVDL